MAEDSGKRLTTVQFDAGLLAEAEELGIDLEATVEEGLRTAVAKERARIWREENAEALEAERALIEREGLTLSDIQILKI
jgi:antitoxin CcdA